MDLLFSISTTDQRKWSLVNVGVLSVSVIAFDLVIAVNPGIEFGIRD